MRIRARAPLDPPASGGLPSRPRGRRPPSTGRSGQARQAPGATTTREVAAPGSRMHPNGRQSSGVGRNDTEDRLGSMGCPGADGSGREEMRGGGASDHTGSGRAPSEVARRRTGGPIRRRHGYARWIPDAASGMPAVALRRNHARCLGRLSPSTGATPRTEPFQPVPAALGNLKARTAQKQPPPHRVFSTFARQLWQLQCHGKSTRNHGDRSPHLPAPNYGPARVFQPKLSALPDPNSELLGSDSGRPPEDRCHSRLAIAQVVCNDFQRNFQRTS